MNDTTAKVQWHPGFVGAAKLEFSSQREELVFESEHNLNTKPLSIDLLIIKKGPDVVINNQIGRLFKEYNIVEYKSPEDQLNIDTFCKVSSYAGLYKSYGDTVDAIKLEDVTVTMVRQTRPQKLFQYFKHHGIALSNPYPGIYYVEDMVIFPTQIIVTREMDGNLHPWLNALSGNLGEKDMRAILSRARQCKEAWEKEAADSVLQVCLGANKELAAKMKKEDEDMCQALRELMEPELLESRLEGERQGEKKGRKTAERKGILVMAKTLKDLGHSEEEIRRSIMTNYRLSPKELSVLLKQV